MKMKRLFPSGLALLLVMGSLGHVFAAAFCPRVLGRACCLVKVAVHTQDASSSLMHSMPMDGMSMDGMPMDGMAPDDFAMDKTATDDMAVDGMLMDHMAMSGGCMDLMSTTSSPLAEDYACAGRVEQPVETCSHCLSHSGIFNAPLSSVSAPDQSNRDLGSLLLPVSRFLVRSAMTVSQSGLPGEHAPPGSSAARHILISVFLI
jgi:hypothetical protein